LIIVLLKTDSKYFFEDMVELMRFIRKCDRNFKCGLMGNLSEMSTIRFILHGVLSSVKMFATRYSYFFLRHEQIVSWFKQLCCYVCIAVKCRCQLAVELHKSNCQENSLKVGKV